MKTFITIPTYNEAKNIEQLVKAILDLKLNIEIVVIDDNSPDNTWKLVEDLSIHNPLIHCVKRINQKGRGLAGIVGFQYALAHGADYIIEMDADFSHDPSYIPSLLKNTNQYDLVLGSRLINGGKDNRGLFRRGITLAANFYIRQMLKLNIKDCTSGFRCFKSDVLKTINLSSLASRGPEVVQEILYAAHLKNFKIGEVPITFKARRQGTSTFNFKTILKSLKAINDFRKKK